MSVRCANPKNTPVATKAVLLVRHGMAGNRSDWKGGDNDRPLDEAGRQQAEALVTVG